MLRTPHCSTHNTQFHLQKWFYIISKDSAEERNETHLLLVCMLISAGLTYTRIFRENTFGLSHKHKHLNALLQMHVLPKNDKLLPGNAKAAEEEK